MEMFVLKSFYVNIRFNIKWKKKYVRKEKSNVLRIEVVEVEDNDVKGIEVFKIK